MTDTIGARLRAAREAAGMTCCDARPGLGDVIGCCASIAEDEKDVPPTPSAETLYAYASTYGVREDWLRTGEEPMREEDV